MGGEQAEKELRGYRVRGVVQGVGFRWWTRDTAVSLGVGGHVRNLLDGSVEAHGYGTPDLLDRFEELLRSGPPMASVVSVERIPGDARARIDRFEIERWR